MSRILQQSHDWLSGTIALRAEPLNRLPHGLNELAEWKLPGITALNRVDRNGETTICAKYFRWDSDATVVLNVHLRHEIVSVGRTRQHDLKHDLTSEVLKHVVLIEHRNSAIGSDKPRSAPEVASGHTLDDSTRVGQDVI